MGRNWYLLCENVTGPMKGQCRRMFNEADYRILDFAWQVAVK
jgi:hypothetical protein